MFICNNVVPWPNPMAPKELGLHPHRNTVLIMRAYVHGAANSIWSSHSNMTCNKDEIRPNILLISHAIRNRTVRQCNLICTKSTSARRREGVIGDPNVANQEGGPSPRRPRLNRRLSPSVSAATANPLRLPLGPFHPYFIQHLSSSVIHPLVYKPICSRSSGRHSSPPPWESSLKQQYISSSKCQHHSLWHITS